MEDRKLNYLFSIFLARSSTRLTVSWPVTGIRNWVLEHFGLATVPVLGLNLKQNFCYWSILKVSFIWICTSLSQFNHRESFETLFAMVHIKTQITFHNLFTQKTFQLQYVFCKFYLPVVPLFSPYCRACNSGG